MRGRGTSQIRIPGGDLCGCEKARADELKLGNGAQGESASGALQGFKLTGSVGSRDRHIALDSKPEW